MKKTIIAIVIVIIVLAAGIAVLLFKTSKPEPEPVKTPPPVSVPQEAKPPQQVLDVPVVKPSEPPLPALSDSDAFMLDALAGLIRPEDGLKYFYSRRVIRKIVATVDGLPRKHLPVNVIPVRRVAGTFQVEVSEGEYAISPDNAGRYATYVKIVGRIDAKKAVEVYVRLYPLFQQAYEDMGYPGKYFNDRLLFVMDHLLAAPRPKVPVKLVRPNVFYRYADPRLEARSAGQKIMMRIGGKNAAVVKSKLLEIKQELMLHMREKKIGGSP